eukprot:gene807-984_t
MDMNAMMQAMGNMSTEQMQQMQQMMGGAGGMVASSTVVKSAASELCGVRVGSDFCVDAGNLCSLQDLEKTGTGTTFYADVDELVLEANRCIASCSPRMGEVLLHPTTEGANMLRRRSPAIKKEKWWERDSFPLRFVAREQATGTVALSLEAASGDGKFFSSLLSPLALHCFALVTSPNPIPKPPTTPRPFFTLQIKIEAGGMPGLPSASSMEPTAVPVPQMAKSIPKAPGTEHWYMVYPNYIDKNKTIPEGRRIPKEKAVENPQLEEIAEICRNLGLKNVGEAKCYPRDWLTPGRVRVELKDANGSSVHPEIKTKKQLMLKLSEQIKLLKSRVEKGAPDSALAMMMKQGKEFANPAEAKAQSKKEEKKNKKKGKK